jgi:hypothetical protein
MGGSILTEGNLEVKTQTTLLSSISRIVNRIVVVITIALMFAMVLIVGIQVFYRFKRFLALVG